MNEVKHKPNPSSAGSSLPCSKPVLLVAFQFGQCTLLPCRCDVPSGSRLGAVQSISPAWLSRCKALDASADGYVRGEACLAAYLHRFDDSATQHDGAGPVTLLCGSATNQDGRSSALTAPSGLAQQAVMLTALAAAALEAMDVAGLSMHGTGTPLGDPVEVAAALAALRSPSLHRGIKTPQRLALMASKSHAGHCEPAAGFVGLSAATVALSNAVATPVLHLRTVNPHVEAAMTMDGNAWAARSGGGLPIAVPAQPACSVSSFAFQVTVAPSRPASPSCTLQDVRPDLHVVCVRDAA